MTFKISNALILFSIILIYTTPVSGQNWKSVPLVSQKILDGGNTGGEGCQVIEAIECDHSNGNFLLMGTDVGGIYRSTDSGKNWLPANIGYNARGNAGFAIDPNNNKRALAVGGNSTKNNAHGLYLTNDQGASWEHVLKIGDYEGYRGFKDKIEFVKSSYDEDLGGSAIAYWSCPSGGIYKSTNGGKNWLKINSSYGNCYLKVHPDSGFIYVANDEGVFKSTDGGISFIKKFSGQVTGFDVVSSAPDNIYLALNNRFFSSTDCGETFNLISTKGFPSKVISLNVSPADAQYMAVCYKENDWGGPIYYSHDGGSTWTISKRSNEYSFMPYNHRHQKFAWHPTNKDKVWALGGDWISGSIDGGANFGWDANGYTGILVGGMFNFNVSNPDLLYVASQDYNGAFTLNGGKTWKYCNASGLGWGGFTYGAYAASKDVLVTQVSESWGAAGILTVSRNGGQSFTKTGIVCNGLQVGCGDAKDENVIYFSDHYSKDSGLTWNKMTGCQGAIIANLFGEKEVYGANATQLVVSKNYGDSWEVVETLPNAVLDIAIDHIKKRLFTVISGNRVIMIENGKQTEITSRIPKDQYNNQSISSVAVDPNNPDIVYVAGAKNIYKSDASVKRSVDGGLTWEIITPNNRTNNGIINGDGGNEIFAIRVNPSTRELWCAGNCYGIWKEIPENKMTINLISPKADSAYIYPDSVTFGAVVINNAGAVSKVEFFNGEELLATDSTTPFQFKWINIGTGNHMVYAKATDEFGNTAFSQTKSIQMLISELPVVSIVIPEKNSEFEMDSNIEILAEASDPDGSVLKVEFFNGTEKLGEDTESPFVFIIDKALEGNYSITAKATDNSNQTVSSEPVNFSVKGNGGAIFYFEDFNDGLAQNWVPAAGTWLVIQNQYRNSTSEGVENCIFEGSTFADFTFSAKANPDWGNKFGLIFNYTDNKNYYLVELAVNPKTVYLKQILSGNETVLKESSYTGGGQYVYIKIEIKNDGKTTSVKIDDKIIFDKIATTKFTFGKIGLYTWYNPLWFDDIQVDAKGKDFSTKTELAEMNTNKINIYPNPAKNVFYIDLNQSGNVKNRIDIFNISGKLVHSETTFENQQLTIVNNWAKPGMYFVKVTNKDFSATKKLVIQN